VCVKVLGPSFDLCVSVQEDNSTNPNPSNAIHRSPEHEWLGHRRGICLMETLATLLYSLDVSGDGTSKDCCERYEHQQK
jgi:hypothetical protein